VGVLSIGRSNKEIGTLFKNQRSHGQGTHDTYPGKALCVEPCRSDQCSNRTRTGSLLRTATRLPLTRIFRIQCDPYS
jgi:hypothetical protein